MSNEPVHVYLNLDVVNNSTTTSQPLVFNETRNMPFLPIVKIIFVPLLDLLYKHLTAYPFLSLIF